MNDSFCKTLILAIASDKPSELTALAKKWGIAIPVSSFGYTDYCALKQRMATFAIDMDDMPNAQEWRDSQYNKWLIWDYGVSNG
jgi:hypothetical protein